MNLVEKDPETIARRGFRGLMNGETVVVPSLTMKASTLMTRMSPRSVNRKVAGFLNREY